MIVLEGISSYESAPGSQDAIFVIFHVRQFICVRPVTSALLAFTKLLFSARPFLWFVSFHFTCLTVI